MEAALALVALWPRQVRPETGLSHAFLLARLDAKRAGAEATINNLRVDRAFGRIEQLTQQTDMARAAEAARAYQRRAVQLGTEAAAPTLRRVVTTETAQAFNEAALEQARVIAVDTGIEMIRVWSAEYGACEVCAGLDGTVVALSDNFPEGEPGSIHPNCACIDEIRPADNSTRKTQPSDVASVAVAEIGGIGKATGMAEGMRSMELHRAAYAGASDVEATAIASGERDVMNVAQMPSNRRFNPVRVEITKMLDGSTEASLIDGRHRVLAAKEAGAKEILAEVRVFKQTRRGFTQKASRTGVFKL